jgi:hypothetical protein
VIFIFLGHIKLTGQFFPEYHTQIKNEFGKLNKEFPLYHLTGWRPYAKTYRIGVGVAEMSAGSLLLLAGGMRIIFYRNKRLVFFVLAFSQSFANLVLLVIMINMTIAFQKLHYGVEYIAGAIFLTFLLVLRLVLASKSKATQAVKTVKKNVEKKME